MAAITKAQILTHVANTLEIEEADITGLIQRWCLEAQRELTLRQDQWPFLLDIFTFPTVADQNEYDLPTIDANLGEVRQLWVDQDRTIEYIDRVEAVRRFGVSSTSSGPPTHWSMWADGATKTIRLWPTPDAIETMTLEGLIVADEGWAATTTSNPFPEIFDDIFINWCTAKAYMQQEDQTQAGAYLNLFEVRMSELRDRYRTAPKSRPMIVNGGVTPTTLGRLRYDWE